MFEPEHPLPEITKKRINFRSARPRSKASHISPVQLTCHITLHTKRGKLGIPVIV